MADGYEGRQNGSGENLKGSIRLGNDLETFELGDRLHVEVNATNDNKAKL